MQPTLTLLREATHPLHQRLDQHPHMQRLLSTELTIEAYVALLARFYGFYGPLELGLGLVGGWPEGLQTAASQRRLPLLARDLTHFGYTQPELEQLPRCAQITPPASLASAAGYLYVIEGANLGSQLIARHLRAQFGLTPDRGLAFFSGHSEQTGPMWRGFGVGVEQLTSAGGSSAEMVAAAQQLFCARPGRGGYLRRHINTSWAHSI